jgi:hypothetical protein
MIPTIRSLALAIAAFAGMNVTAQAIGFTPPNPADFAISESPGRYTVFNNSSDWYIYAFAVSNPAAGLPGASATTTFTNWNGFVTTLDLGTGTTQPVFAYASGDANLSDITNPFLNVVHLANYIAPGTNENEFLYSALAASVFGMLLVDVNGDLATINGSSETPLPAALPLFATGAGLFFFARGRKRKNKSG